MVLATTPIHTPAGLRYRAILLLLCGFLCGPLTGCTMFQSVCTAKWLEEADPPIDHVAVRWDDRIRTAQDPATYTSGIQGMIGRVYLFSEETSKMCEAHGTIVVGMLDMTPTAVGKPPVAVAEWMFDSQTLKKLKVKDPISGVGYTLFLPWQEYRPEIKKVKLLLKYVTDKGESHMADASLVTIQAGEQPLVAMHESIGPTLELRNDPRKWMPNQLPLGATQPPANAPMQQQPMPPPSPTGTMVPQPKVVAGPSSQQQQSDAACQPILMQSQVRNPPAIQPQQFGTQAQYVPITERQLPPGSYQLPPPGTTVTYLPPPPR